MASKERAFTFTENNGVYTVQSYGAILSSYGYQYDACNNLSKLTCSVLGSSWSTIYTYDDDNRPSTTTLASGKVISNTYDAIGRLTNRAIGLNTTYNTTLTYVPGNATNKTTGLVSTYQNGSDAAYEYEYDAVGNITAITQGSTSISYEYDAANRLTRENNQVTNQTVTYEYDDFGNIQNRKVYAYTTAENPGTPSSTVSYAYTNSAWGDQLTEYDGQTIVYDSMGNPTTYRGYTMTWRGKQLAGFTGGTKSIAFEYNEDGLRQQKTYNGVVTNYYYNGSVLIGMQRGTAKERFSYDASGNVVSVIHNGTEYYYLRNAQGDIVKLIDASGATVVEYTYDTWGKKVSTTGSLAGSLGLIQPFRYRGYVYDWETGLYYLQSRYYDPEVGRFISADVLLSTGQGVLGHNCYAYCLGNPVGMVDDGGTAASRNNTVIMADGRSGRMQKRATYRRDPLIHVCWFSEGQEQEAIDALYAGDCTVYYRGALLVTFSDPKRASYTLFGTIHVNNLDMRFTPTDLKHEYGHFLQEKVLGPSYIFKIGIPSAICSYFSGKDKDFYAIYYSIPTERLADFMGGVTEDERIQSGNPYAWWSAPASLLFGIFSLLG